MKDLVAVIDIGTLKVKFVVMEVSTNGAVEEKYSSSNLTSFGCDIDETTGEILDKNLQATIKELLRCRKVLDDYKVKKCRVVSTHVMRRIGNALQVIQMVKDKTGFEIEVISQEEEALLFFKAAMCGFENAQREYALVDVGGGSVQILVGQHSNLSKTLLLQTGAAFLHENFTNNPTDPHSFTTEQDIDRMKEHILKQLAPIKDIKKVPLIYGSSNIIDLMKAIKIPLEDHYQSNTHPYKTYSKYLEAFTKRVLPLNYEQRENKYPFQYGYMWGIDKAFANIVTISKYFESPYIIPSNANIAKGLVYSMISG